MSTVHICLWKNAAIPQELQSKHVYVILMLMSITLQQINLIKYSKVEQGIKVLSLKEEAEVEHSISWSHLNQVEEAAQTLVRAVVANKFDVE